MVFNLKSFCWVLFILLYMLRWNENGNFIRRGIFGVHALGYVVILIQYIEEGGIVVTGYNKKVHYIFDSSVQKTRGLPGKLPYWLS